ncbi:MAG: DUF308 domain-containing protein [Candidatus Pacebacteria bacterium]|nr:DUF308 domain-containing protein [Candidatus Paceibacterota bacterium]
MKNFFIINIFDNYVKNISGNWWIVFLTGLTAVVLGVSFIIWPIEAMKIIIYFIGLVIVVVGLFYIKNSFMIKRIGKKYENLKEDIKSRFE